MLAASGPHIDLAFGEWNLQFIGIFQNCPLKLLFRLSNFYRFIEHAWYEDKNFRLTEFNSNNQINNKIENSGSGSNKEILVRSRFQSFKMAQLTNYWSYSINRVGRKIGVLHEVLKFVNPE